MANITVSVDCGNAPKKMLLRDLYIAFAQGHPEFILENMADDIEWNKVGSEHLKGKEHFARALSKWNEDRVAELEIDKIVTHGVDAAANGTIRFSRGNIYAFCDVYRFSGFKYAKIKSITSYVINL